MRRTAPAPPTSPGSCCAGAELYSFVHEEDAGDDEDMDAAQLAADKDDNDDVLRNMDGSVISAVSAACAQAVIAATMQCVC